MNNRLTGFVKQLRTISTTDGLEGRTDRELLQQFVREGDETSFAEVVHRHGPMVLGVCRRMLGNPHDAEDAFQATFVVLVRKAGSLNGYDSVGNWLYQVAYRVSMKTRAYVARRRTREQQEWEIPFAEDNPADCTMQKDMKEVLDEELQGLPANCRLPLVLCYLQGKTHEEAARELGWPRGSIAKRLARAQDLLRSRLVRRGIAVTSAIIGPLLLDAAAAEAAIPAALATSTLQSVKVSALAGAAATPVSTIADGVVHSLFVSRVKDFSMFAVACVIAGIGIAGAGWIWQHAGTTEPTPVVAAPPAATASVEQASNDPAPNDVLREKTKQAILNAEGYFAFASGVGKRPESFKKKPDKDQFDYNLKSAAKDITAAHACFEWAEACLDPGQASFYESALNKVRSAKLHTKAALKNVLKHSDVVQMSREWANEPLPDIDLRDHALRDVARAEAFLTVVSADVRKAGLSPERFEELSKFLEASRTDIAGARSYIEWADVSDTDARELYYRSAITKAKSSFVNCDRAFKRISP